jgi:hypothetical protein
MKCAVRKAEKVHTFCLSSCNGLTEVMIYGVESKTNVTAATAMMRE